MVVRGRDFLLSAYPDVIRVKSGRSVSEHDMATTKDKMIKNGFFMTIVLKVVRMGRSEK